MTFTVLGITITVKTQSAPEVDWYPGAHTARPVDFYEASKAKAAHLWTIYR